MDQTIVQLANLPARDGGNSVHSEKPADLTELELTELAQHMSSDDGVPILHATDASHNIIKCVRAAACGPSLGFSRQRPRSARAWITPLVPGRGGTSSLLFFSLAEPLAGPMRSIGSKAITSRSQTMTPSKSASECCAAVRHSLPSPIHHLFPRSGIARARPLQHSLTFPWPPVPRGRRLWDQQDTYAR
jgi:hypothetical protein